jgi:hypothetical protein
MQITGMYNIFSNIQALPKLSNDTMFIEISWGLLRNIMFYRQPPPFARAGDIM